MDSSIISNRKRAEHAASLALKYAKIAIEGSIFNPLYISVTEDELPNNYVGGTGTPYGAYPLSTGGVQPVYWDFDLNEWVNIGFPLARVGEGGGGGGITNPELEFRIQGGYLQYRISSSSPWVNLTPISTITGPQGPQGVQGPVGPPGASTFGQLTGNPLDNNALEQLFDSKADLNQPSQNRNSNYTFNVSHPSRIDRITASSNITVNLNNSNIPVNYWRVIRQVGSGRAILNDSGLVIRGNKQTSGPNTELLLHKIGASEWDSYGG